jgi:hypothetical protein
VKMELGERRDLGCRASPLFLVEGINESDVQQKNCCIASREDYYRRGAGMLFSEARK